MNSSIETLNQFGVQFLTFAWPMLWQSSALILILFALEFLLRRKLRASIRYALWLIVLAKLILPPTLALPTNPVWWLHKSSPIVQTQPQIKNFSVTYDSQTLPQIPKFLPQTFSPPKPKLTFAAWSLAISIFASLGLFVWMLLRWRKVVQQIHRAHNSERISILLAEIKKSANLKFNFNPQLKLTANSMSPAVCGLFRPVILIPQSLAENFSDEQLRAVLLHELIHLRRGDVWLNFAQTLLQIFYWWHPLLWFANARIRRVREEAVDDAVMLALRHDAETYAPTLLEVAKLALQRPLATLGLVGILESRHALRQRIERLLDFRAPKKAGLTFLSLCGIFIFSAVALPMGNAPVPTKKNLTSDVINAESQQLAMNFKLVHFEGENVLKEQLFEAGVTMPPTIIHNFNNGIIFARGTSEQLILIQQMVFKLNGFSPQEVAAATNIPDNVVKIPVDESTAQLYSRTFGVNRNVIFANLLEQTGAQSNAVISTDLSVAFRKLFIKLGLNFESPPGKSIFYNDKLSKLFAKATTTDLNVIELAVMGLIQPSAQNVSGYSPPVDAINVVGITGVSADSNFLAAAQALKQQNGIETLPEPEVTTTSGREINQIAMTNLSAPVSKADVELLVQDGKLLYEIGRRNEAAEKLKAALALDPENTLAKYYLNLAQTNGHAAGLTYTGPGRQQIVKKLEIIRLENVRFEAVPLAEVLRTLSAESIKRDADHRGINFLINLNSSQVAGTVDPTTGLTMATNAAAVEDLGALPITLALTNVNLGAVLDAVLKASPKIRYSIQDYAVVFSAKGPETPQLFMRTFKVHAHGFTNAFFISPDLQTNNVPAMAKSFFSKLGVDLQQPSGKSVFYNERLGLLFVKATEADLDKIENALEKIQSQPPQIHIKARFFEMPKGTLAFPESARGTNKISGGLTGILTSENFKTILKNLESRPNVEVLAEPEVTTLSGRQTQMRATEVVTVITNLTFQDSWTNQDGVLVTNAIVPQTSQIETGPILDVIPYVLSDDCTINLTLIPSVTEFRGYKKNTNTTAKYDRAGEKIDVPTILPRFDIRQTVATVNLWDGQTAVIGSLPEKDYVNGKEVFDQSKSSDKEVFIFVTATIVDAAGNRVHSDADLSAIQKGIPPQPNSK